MLQLLRLVENQELGHLQSMKDEDIITASSGYNGNEIDAEENGDGLDLPLV